MARRATSPITTTASTRSSDGSVTSRGASTSTRPSKRPSRRPKAGPAPTLILLVRHGVTATTGKVLPGRAKGLHLAEAGAAQAETAATRIAGLKRVDAVYASPLERTRETAAPIGRSTGLKVKVSKGLLECDFGDWTGAKLADLQKLPEWSTVQKSPSSFRFPGGESFI